MTDKDRELLVRVDERVAQLIAEVKGSDKQPGLVQRVSDLETWRSGLVAVWAFVLAAIGIYAAVKKA